MQAGDDVTTHANSEILAAGSIDIYGDFSNADVDHGTEMILRGRIIAGAVVTPGSESGDSPVGSAVPTFTAPVFMTRIWGHTDGDVFQFGDSGGAAGGTGQGDAGYIFLGSKTRVFGSQDLDASGNDGEDQFRVFYLQDAAVTTGPANVSAAEHTLTLDGQADSDYYEVHTLGSNGIDERNYVINALDTGAANDGVDELLIRGRDSALDGIDPSTGQKYAADDIFLLRTASFLPNESADRPAYVAVLHGDVATYRDRDPDNSTSDEVQRINYDSGLNGRVTVEGRGGNDFFASDDTSAIVTLDGGAGADSFRIGQIFGNKRDAAEGTLLAQDVFPDLVATTRGWLSPGTNAPMVVHGGTGNDEFTVYSNQAELRLEGDDGNDLFTVRAFAIAAVSSKDWNGDGVIDPDDLDAVDVDSNGDGTINAADADETPGDWTDDVLLTDENGVAIPRIGSQFSVGKAPDIRTGGGDDEVQYNINAPLSVDGGTGFDKLLILGTEFADDFVITAKGVFGGGLNVRFSDVEVLEIDGLEGDDEFFVQSTAFGISYRVVGGLGSDTINVASDVNEDIVTRELEGLSGSADHLVTSDDALYDGLVIDGIDLNVATPEQGNVVITETGGFTAVREGGPVKADSYFIRLAVMPTAKVYLTVSAARASQEEADNAFANPLPLPSGAADSIWVSTSANLADPLPGQFQRTVLIDGNPAQVASRAVVLTFDALNWEVDQEVFIFAPDDTRAEGDKVVMVQHSVISDDADFDGVDVRNVEVAVRDNDTPGILVTEVALGTNIEDGRTLVIEGTSLTGLRDDILVQLSKAPVAGSIVVLKLDLDVDSDAQIRLLSTDARFDAINRTVTFDSTNWNAPIRLTIEARDDFRREDVGTAVITFERDNATTDASFVFPNLRSGPGVLDVEVIDNETAGAVVLESGGATQVVRGGAGDDYTIRLTQQPTDSVQIAVLTDGLTDVASIGGIAATLQAIGGYQPSQRFTGGIVFADVSGKGTLTRGSANALGSFIDEGLRPGQLLRIGGSAFDGDYYIESLNDGKITLTTALGVSGSVEDATVVLSALARQGLWEGDASFDGSLRQLIRTDDSSWLADGFLEGQRVRVTHDASGLFVDLKIALIRGDNATTDEKLEFTAEGALPAWWSGDASVTVTRLAAVANFTTANWFAQQTVVLQADVHYDVPPTRDGVKVFPVQTHLLSKLRGPLAVEGGVTGADRSLQNGLKLPGETDDYLIAIGAQAPESQQIDVLNIYNDSSQENGSGTMTSTGLSGFGMARDLEFESSGFGEPTVVAGGINFGSINFGSGGFGTDADESTIEVVNLMLGEGNDRLTIEGTLNAAPSVSASNVFVLEGSATGGTVARDGFDWKAQGFLPGQSVTIVGLSGTWTVAGIDGADPADPNDNSVLVLEGLPLASQTGELRLVASDRLVNITTMVSIAASANGGTITRSSGQWRDDGFIVGQLVMIDGKQGNWRLVNISSDGLSMTVRGEPLAAQTGVQKNFSVAGPHGGLTVVHGGGNALLENAGQMHRAGHTFTRLDGLDWSADGYQVGQHVQLSGEANTRLIVAIVDADPALAPADAFGTWGAKAGLVLSGPAFSTGVSTLSVHVSEARRTEVTEAIDIGSNTLTRSGGNWSDAGFYAGQKIFIDGIVGPFTIANLTGNRMQLAGPALIPHAGVVLNVFGFDESLDGGARIGGDHIVITGGAGPDSPLVVYGDTSQDGVWYSGHPFDVLGYEFGEKPFDPFPLLPDADNEDDEWVFPLANPYTYAGNDVIDASALFAGVSSANMPSVGFTAYGGAGDDLIIGSQAGDHLAGGSGNDTIRGQRGEDHIYGDSGVNVNIFTRGLTIDVVDNSPRPSIDSRLDTNGTTIDPAPSPVRDDLSAGRDTLYGEEDSDIIFGDHGAVIQDVADPHLPDPRLQKIQTTVLRSVLTIESRSFENGNDDVIYGNDAEDVILGGAGADYIDAGADNSKDVVIGDNGRATFSGTQPFGPGESEAILSFNFNSSPTNAAVTGVAGAPGAVAGNWNNLSSDQHQHGDDDDDDDHDNKHAPITYGDDSGELVYFDDGLIVPGVTITWGENLDRHDRQEPDTDTHSNLTPGTDQNKRIFEGALVSDTDDTVGVTIDGLWGHFSSYSLFVYIDLDDKQSASYSSVRSVTVITEDGAQHVKYLNDPDGHTFNGNFDGFYVRFDNLTSDSVKIRVNDANPPYSKYNNPGINAVQVVGQRHLIDRLETLAPTAGGSDRIFTGGGEDIVFGGKDGDFTDAQGQLVQFGDYLNTYGNSIFGDIDDDVAVGDEARATFVFRGFADAPVEPGPMFLLGELRELETRNEETSAANPVLSGDQIFTGNGRDVAIGGNGGDTIDTGVPGADSYDYGNVRVVSVNFNSGAEKAVVTGAAGAVAADRWNNLPSLGMGTVGGLVDEDGVATGISVAWGSEHYSGLTKSADRETHAELYPDTQNERLFEGFLSEDGNRRLGVNLAGLGSLGTYDVYVYLDNDFDHHDDDDDDDEDDGWHDTGVVSISAGGIVHYVDDRGTFDGNFVDASSVNRSAPGRGNYVVFRDLTLSQLSIRLAEDDWKYNHEGGEASIAGIQIVSGADRSKVIDVAAGKIGGDFDEDRAIGDNALVRFFFEGEAYEIVTTDLVQAAASSPFQADTIRTGEGADIAIGGNGNDRISGEEGHDLLLGDNVHLILFDAQVIGLDDFGDWDHKHGHDHDDHDHDHKHHFNPFDIQGIELLGDRIGGNDTIEGGKDDDLMYGQFGDDTYVFAGGGLGRDAVVEAGGDHHHHDHGHHDHDGDDDDDDHHHHHHENHGPNDLHDRLDFSQFIGPVDVDLSNAHTQTVNGYRHEGDINLTLTLFHGDAIEDVIGSEFSDHIDGNSRNNTLIGLAGNDVIEGFGGNDVLRGNDGNDELNGGDGDDLLDGGAGNDVLYGGRRGHHHDDDDHHHHHGHDGDHHGDDDDDHDDHGHHSHGSDVLLGGDGDDYLEGGDGSDYLDGGAGNDVLYGGGNHGHDDDDDDHHPGYGADILLGGSGNDQLFGSKGDDLLIGGAGDDRLEGEEGNDILLGEAGNDWIDGGKGADFIDGGDGNDTIYGGYDDDLILGGAGNDYIDAGKGNDLADGEAGNDNIMGGSDDDVLFGGSGVDVLSGDSGRDSLIGDDYGALNEADVIKKDSKDLLVEQLGTTKVSGIRAYLTRFDLVFHTRAFTFAPAIGSVGQELPTRAWIAAWLNTLPGIAGAHPLVASNAPLLPYTGSDLDAATLARAVDAAVSIWSRTLGAADPGIELLQFLSYGLADLDGLELGQVRNGGILIDLNAAGHGWYVDVSAASSREFSIRLDDNVVKAAAGSAASGRIDLLSVILHEIGHVLGLDHEDAARYPLMSDELDPGVRYLLDELGFDGDPDVPVDDAALLRLARQAAQREAAGKVTAANQLPAFEFDQSRKSESAGVQIDWSERLRGGWGTLSPFGSGAIKSAQNFADFLAKVVGEDDDENDDDASQPDGNKGAKFDKMGSTLNSGKNVKPGKGASR